MKTFFNQVDLDLSPTSGLWKNKSQKSLVICQNSATRVKMCDGALLWLPGKDDGFTKIMKVIEKWEIILFRILMDFVRISRVFAGFASASFFKSFALFSDLMFPNFSVLSNYDLIFGGGGYTPLPTMTKYRT